ncbi:MAG: class III lanthionine synthetase LanKC N-terminal domain-containing protein [Pyrinomonadaceae bacterium]
MVDDSVWRTIENSARAQTLERQWRQLCVRYLPRAPKDSIWRYRYGVNRRLPESGWKLHISATILNAPGILNRIAPFLIDRRVQFKAARTLSDVSKLNSGLYHSYSQIGKVITVYPQSEAQAIYLAERLHELTRRFAAPAVPFDLRFAQASNVYYRFGAFRQVSIEHPDGGRTLAIRKPSGELVPDERDNPKPDWVRDPFEDLRVHKQRRKSISAGTPFRVMNALIQRGKGGVYQAIDFSASPPRRCLLKEGRKHGELTWDGRDGAWRVRNEERVLKRLTACGVTVPEVYASFEVKGNVYLAMEFIEGESLHNLLLKRRRRLPLARVLSYGAQLSLFLSRMHQAGWTWRDCKPKNLIVTEGERLVPIDFEGAAEIDRPDRLLWGTPGFVPPERQRHSDGNAIPDDLYALGSVLYLLLTGRVFDRNQPLAIKRLRPGVPHEFCGLVGSLLDEDQEKRPGAQSVSAALTSILLNCSRQPRRLRDALAA